jgi:hypothetical protein
MKNNKLSLEKFRISKLNNPSKILGGNVDDIGETGKGKCVAGSAFIVKDKE